MAERKAVNRYFAPDFDPDAPMPTGPRFLIPKTEPASKPLRSVRLMLPFTLRCQACGEFIYKGRKFNARKETCWGETYLGVQIYRFYIRCTLCAAEITYITDPEHADYRVERGATRNSEPWRQELKESEALKVKRALEEEHDPMRKLENRTIDSRQEIDVTERLEDIRTIKARLEKVSSTATTHRTKQEEPQEEVQDDASVAPSLDAFSEALSRRTVLRPQDLIQYNPPSVHRISSLAEKRKALGL